MVSVCVDRVQDMASQGLSVIYQLGDADAREQLLKSLMGTLQGALCSEFLFSAELVAFCAAIAQSGNCTSSYDIAVYAALLL